MLFSVVIPTFNRADLISGAVESVLGQTFADWELIVVDDASTDRTPEVLARYGDPRVRVLRNEVNRERSASRNRGIDAARGDYVCFLDSDDLYLPGHLATLACVIEAAPVKEALFFTQFLRRHDDGREEPVTFPPVGGNRVEYLIRNQIATPTTCIHRSLLAGERFDPRLKINEDVDLYARIAARAPVVRIEAVTVHTFFHAANTMASVRDYVTPQMTAMRKIFAHPETGRIVTPRFKREIMVNLRHQRVPIAWRQGRWAAFKALSSFLIRYPLEPLNRAKWILLLAVLPVIGTIPAVRRASQVIIESYY